MHLFLHYLLIVNALGLFIMPIDKDNAKKGWHRVPEITLMTIAFLGGSIGMCAGMFIFRHKTKKPLFKLGIFALVIFHVSIAIIFTRGVL